MKLMQGDLIQLALSGHFDVIIHGCNCDCIMGAGIARAIREHFPEAFEADQATSPGDTTKLGTYSFARCERNRHTIHVINAYSQAHPSGAGVLVDYAAVRRVMRSLKRDFSGRRFGYPKLGAGLARGDWAIIGKIIDEELAGEDHTLVAYSPPSS
ncbi:MAG: hypothetical protein RL518_1550 [Pseudomonadota bacterium]|jgi:O-acetyl-ADP-ribose deacetylase (regulator of RNase III)